MGYCTKAQVISLLRNVTECEIEQTWIDWATSEVDNYTGTVFGQETEVEEFYDIDKEGQDSVILEHYPVTEVIYVKDDGETVLTTDYMLYKKDGIIALRVDTVLNALFDVPYFTKGRQMVEVKYKYGYADVPQEIQLACALFAADLALGKLKKSISEAEVEGEKIGEYSVDYTKAKYTLEKKIKDDLARAKKEILDKYKVIGLDAKSV